jgi:glycosyltransferase involved in cell wall biosynthesis
MRLIQIHNRYTQPGGEDVSTEAESAILRSGGQEVLEFKAGNAEAISAGYLPLARILANSAWNRRSYERARQVIRGFRPDVVHVHNFWFALSPSVLGAARDEGVPTVMTLHNFRLICPGALLMHGGKICERCVGRSPWHGVFRKCYRSSALQTALVARMITRNQRAGTWDHLVDAYIAMTDFCRDVFIRGGLPADRIFVKPNCLQDDPGPAEASGVGAVFVGRLSAEKGLATLLSAWEQFPGIPLTIVGDGPDHHSLQSLAATMRNVKLVGYATVPDVLVQIKRAGLLVLSSECYETFGRCIIEAYACGRPVIASRLGSVVQLVKDGETGLLFEPGNSRDLAAKVKALLANPAELERMGRNARAEFEKKYTAERNYEQLMTIYRQVIRRQCAT